MIQKISVLFLVFLFLNSSSTYIQGQQVIRFATLRASEAEDLLYSEHFKSYTIASLPTEETSDLLRSKNHFSELVIETKGRTFSFNLTARDIRSANYKLRVQDDQGIHELPRSPNKTYYGYTNEGNHDVRITADDHFFYALIQQDNDEFYIEPANNINPTAPDDQFVMYWASDNLKKLTQDACGVKPTLTPQHIPDEDQPPIVEDQNRLLVCKEVQIALANDFLMFQAEGSVTEVENHNMAVINNVETNYDNEFTTELQFVVVEIFVPATSGADPFSNSTNIDVILDEFTAWAPNPNPNIGFSNTHDVGGLWSDRNFDGTTVGLAWVSAICTIVRYHALENFTSNANLLRCLQSHELGHNFSAEHDASGSPHIMAPTVQNTNTWSAASLADINAYIPTRTCLGPCGSPLPPVAAFDADDTEGCASFIVHFSDESTNSPTGWSWTFQGGSPPTSTSQNPTITYNNPGVFDVSLTVSNSSGSNSLTQQDFITVGDDPIADFDFVIDGLVVEFENLSEGATSYSWEFGDGGSSTQANPVHLYEEDGIYDVVLTATNACGFDIIIMEIEIITPPIADFDADPTSGCNPTEVEFLNFSSANAVSFFWNFPGGIPATSTAFEPTVLYETAGTFSVTLTAINDAGQDVLTLNNLITIIPLPSAVFDFTAAGLTVTFTSAGSIGNSYLWNFGDGETSTMANPVHVYDAGGTYTVTLTVTNQCGNDTELIQVPVTTAPIAGFSSNVTTGCSPLVVQYINQSIGTINTYNWTFQGGTPPTSNLANPVVTYNSPGVFDVTLMVTNTVGSDTQFNDNYITVGEATYSDFTFFVDGTEVLFTNFSENATEYNWNFGDGNTSTAENPVHIYNAGGTYTVTLISEGFCGNDTSTAQVTIQSLPVANFTFQQNGSCAPATVQFTNQSSPNVTSFKWTFEGGTPMMSTQANPLVSYNTPGIYDVQLIVFSPAGSDTLTMPSIINLGTLPESDFLISTDGLTVTLTNESMNATFLEWEFGDGNFSEESNPVHTYANFGTYTIVLIAGNSCGADTSEIQIVLGTEPNAAFTYSDHNGCVPFEVFFTDQSQNNPTSWMWTFEGGAPPTSLLQNPAVVYFAPGNYTVSLQVTNAEGSDVLVLMELIEVADPPDATFEYLVVGNLVSLIYPGIDYDSLHWDFGDGRTDASLNPTVQYAASGQYQITLTVFNACGIDTHSVDVVIQGTATNDPYNNGNKWQIRPNPFDDKFSVYGEPLKEGEVIITLFDVHGKLISRESWSHKAGPDNKEISGDQFPSGIILVHIQDGNSRVVLKAVKQ